MFALTDSSSGLLRLQHLLHTVLAYTRGIHATGSSNRLPFLSLLRGSLVPMDHFIAVRALGSRKPPRWFSARHRFSRAPSPLLRPPSRVPSPSRVNSPPRGRVSRERTLVWTERLATGRTSNEPWFSGRSRVAVWISSNFGSFLVDGKRVGYSFIPREDTRNCSESLGFWFFRFGGNYVSKD